MIVRQRYRRIIFGPFFGPLLQAWRFATMGVTERSGHYLRAFLGRAPLKIRLSLKNLTLVLHTCQG
jgi:hypothetical protein